MFRKIRDRWFLRRLVRDLKMRGAEVIRVQHPVTLNPYNVDDVIQVNVISVSHLLDEAVPGTVVFLHRISLIRYDGVIRVRAAIRKYDR